MTAVEPVEGGGDEESWTAELAIPFRTISFNPQAGSWGLNVQRTIRRRQEIVR